jgi:hypothetical protein
MGKSSFAYAFLMMLPLVSFFYYGSTVATGSDIHDVAVLDTSTFPAKIVGGGWITTNVTVENQGTSIETFNLTLRVSYESFWNGVPYASGNLTILNNATIFDLEPGTNRTITLRWEIFPWRWEIWPPLEELLFWQTLLTANFTVIIELETVPGEADVSDNLYVDGSVIAFWIITDINGDGKIDMKDIARVARAFGSYPGHERWDP